ncbi:MAG: HAMP domain-containing histidine kinase [Lachnospiraceae bacterium]|nr:HAMP domain-containing histidine kinase [Lachnospiraceae bacterium]MDE7200364.1 HAMP domain-containing histidine kinase [Lachnospiraceae bacterium]
MVPWVLVCVAGAVVIMVLVVKIFFLYRDLEEIGVQFEERLRENTNNRIYVPGNDRNIKAFAERMNRELGVLYDSRRKYQNGDRELKEAVTNISHDLRTPLTAIYGYLELLDAELESETGSRCTSDGQDTKCEIQNNSIIQDIHTVVHDELNVGRLTHYLAQIRNRADAMHLLTEELFRYSIILSTSQENAANQQTMVDSRVDSSQEKVVLNHFLADCLLCYYDIFRQNQIEPEVKIADEEVVRFLDTGSLKRIFCNILDNAAKYSKPVPCSGGMHSEQAALSVELLSDGTITFRNSAQNLDWVSVERLFDRFYTVETGRNSTGLGLSIAKLLTERMGGSISAAYTDGMLEIVVKL